MSLIKEIKTLLQDSINLPINLSIIQDLKEEICIRQFGGNGLNPIDFTEEIYFQIYIKCKNYEECVNTLELCRDKFLNISFIKDGYSYRQIREITSPTEVGKNELTQNFVILRVKEEK